MEAASGEAALLGGGVPGTSFALPGTAEDAAAIRPLIGSYNAILLRQHDTLTCGVTAIVTENGIVQPPFEEGLRRVTAA